MRHWLRHPRERSVFLSACLVAVGCKAAEPHNNGHATPSGNSEDSGTSADTDCAEDIALPPVDGGTCPPLAQDYQPRTNASADDTWPPCVTDDGAYHLVADTPSSIARVEAAETVAGILWRNGPPTPTQFTEARDQYSMEEGLESRLVRREDLHYPPIPMADWVDGVDADKQCTIAANVTKYPDRCAGPAKIGPMIRDAFAAGQRGEGHPAVLAARIEAGLLWFLYLSAHKECFTCTLKAKDCDSCWAYYTGGYDRGGGIGLSGAVRAISDPSHQAIWDGFTAVRCWRDLYPDAAYPTWEEVPPEGQALHATGWEQLDNAVLRGLAVVMRDRMATYAGVCGTNEARAPWAFLQIAGPVMDREARDRDPIAADDLAVLWAHDAPTASEIMDGITALDAVFPCPQP
ncbi:MAG: hypothetical protein V3V08_04065 [Nannocystaceae bacterium]